MRDVTLVVSTVLLVSVIAAVWCTEWSDRSDGSGQTARSALAQQHERSRLLDAQMAQRKAFAAYCDVQLFKVAFGAKPLADACRDIECYAAVHYPAYLKGVELLGKGRTLREKVAHNLVCGLTTPRLHHNRRIHDAMIALRLVGEMTEAMPQP